VCVRARACVCVGEYTLFKGSVPAPARPVRSISDMYVSTYIPISISIRLRVRVQGSGSSRCR